MSDVIKRYGNTMLGYYPGLDCTIIGGNEIFVQILDFLER